ncbi:hypothetical protein JCM11491_004455 [Sporobolomyces phaffii]
MARCKVTARKSYGGIPRRRVEVRRLSSDPPDDQGEGSEADEVDPEEAPPAKRRKVDETPTETRSGEETEHAREGRLTGDTDEDSVVQGGPQDREPEAQGETRVICEDERLGGEIDAPGTTSRE